MVLPKASQSGLLMLSVSPSSVVSAVANESLTCKTAKTKKTYLTKSHNGGVWTIAVVVFCTWLTITEFWRWWAGTTTHTFSVEKGVAHDLQLNLDIIIAMKCEDLHVNVQDASGDRVFAGEMLTMAPTVWDAWSSGMVVQRHTGQKLRKDEPHNPGWVVEQLGQYQKEEDVHKYLRKARGSKQFSSTPRLPRGQEANSCRIFGSVEGNKVQGDFHITARGHGYTEWGQQHLDHASKKYHCRKLLQKQITDMMPTQPSTSPTTSTSSPSDPSSPPSRSLSTARTRRPNIISTNTSTTSPSSPPSTPTSPTSSRRRRRHRLPHATPRSCAAASSLCASSRT